MNGFALLYFKLNFTVIHLLELLAIINAFDYKVHGTSIKSPIVLFWFIKEKVVDFFRLYDRK